MPEQALKDFTPLVNPPITSVTHLDTGTLEGSFTLEEYPFLTGINILAHGAVGDDSTDNTTAIQSALDAVPAAGGIVFIPIGIFQSGELNIDHNTYLLGAGEGSVIKLKAGAVSNTDMLQAIGKDNITIDSITFDGNASNQTDGNSWLQHGSVTPSTTGLTVQNCTIKNIWGDGYYNPYDVYQNYNIKIINNRFDNTNAGEAGASINAQHKCQGIIISGNHITNVTHAAANAMWVGNDSDFAVITNNVITDIGDMGIEYIANDDAAQGVGRGIISGNVIDNCGTFGISVAASPNTVVANNTVRDATSLAIEIAASDNCIIQGNYLEDLSAIAAMGVHIDKSSRCIVDSNICLDFGEATASNAGIRVFANGTSVSNENIVSNNYIRMRPATVNLQGLMVMNNTSTSDCHNNLIENNMVVGDNSSGSIGCRVVPFAGSTSGNVVQGNYFSTLKKGVEVSSLADTTTVKDNHFQACEVEINDAGAPTSDTMIVQFGSGGKGVDIASGSTIAIPTTGGKYFDITGTAKINTITASWIGREVILQSDSTAPYGHGTGNLLLEGGRDFYPSANNILKLICDGTSWREVSRSNYATIDVRDYGAVGDGSTNDTTAIHAARDAAGVGGTVYFPKTSSGQYNVGSVGVGLLANVASQTWLVAPGVTIFQTSGSNIQILRIQANGITIDGGIWDHNGTGGQNGEQGFGILAGTDNVTIKNLTINDADLWGISGSDVDYLTIDNVTINDSADVGIFVDSSDAADHPGLKITNCHIDRSTLGAGISGGGIQVRAESGQRLVNAIIEKNQCYMPTAATNSIPIEVWDTNGGKVMWNYTEGGTISLSMDRCIDTVIHGNHCFNFNTYGLESVQMVDCVFSSNTVDGNGTGTSEGMSGSLVNTNVKVLGNSFTNIDGNGVHWQGNSLHINISNNSFDFAVTDGSHILIEDTDHWIISGNTHKSDGVTDHRCVAISYSNYGSITNNNFVDWDGANSPIHLSAPDAVVYDRITMQGNVMSPAGLLYEEFFDTAATMGDHISAIGNPGFERSGYRIDVLNHNLDLINAHGTGTPEGNLTAGIGSTFHRDDGGFGATEYTKTSGTGNTGWSPVVTPSISANNGDAAATLVVSGDETTQIWDTAITADRAVTLSTTDAENGHTFRVIRTANATGAFNLNVGTGPLKAIGNAGEWCDVQYDGTAWILTAFGSL